MDHVEALETWHRAASALLPPSTLVWDAHSHTGDADPDGVAQTAGQMVAALRRAGHARAVVCTSADPSGYPAANDRVLAETAASEGMLIPFMRVDPGRSGAVAEVERCAAAGHRGLKLHPRSEAFGFDTPAVEGVLDAAAGHGLPVLVHAGRAMPPLGPVVADHLDRRPGLTIILAHGAISDLGWAAPASLTRPGLLFDTSWWNPADLGALFAWVDASQILYASDTPYGWPSMSATLTIRAAVQAGLAGAALTAVFGGNLRHLLDGKRTAAMGTGVEVRLDAVLLRVAANLYGAVQALFADADPMQSIDLAIRATEVTGTQHDELLRAIGATLEIARLPAAGQGRRARLGAVLAALSASATPGVPVPSTFATLGGRPD